MNRTTSIYLDLVRFSAALVVVLTHLAYPRFSGGLLLPLRTYGNDAVMIFFVLSGYVIAYTATRDRELGTYCINRLARLYSVALPAIVLTFLLDQSGRLLDPALYDGFWYRGDAPLARMLAALTFTNELWFRSLRLFTNGPYWSLGYEFWYYVLFACAWYLRGLPRVLGLVLVSALIGPKILLLLPVWALGVWVCRINTRDTLSPALGAVLALGSIASYVAFRAYGFRDALLEWSYELLGRGFVNHELAWSNEFISAYAIGLMVAANFIGMHALSARMAPLLAAVERPVRACAGFTFSIYLFHYPLLQFLKAALPLDAQSPLHILVLLVATVLACCALGRYTEQRKDVARAVWQAIFSWVQAHWRGLARGGA